MRSLILPLCFVVHFWAGPCGAAEVVEVKVETTGSRSVDWGRLMGGNLALWFESERLEDEEISGFLKDWKPGLIRIPGGSWSDEFVWNGHGVKSGDDFDPGKWKDGRWEIDYSGYAPGFRLGNIDGTPIGDGFHGHVDVKYLHEYIQKLGVESLVTVNAGYGDPKMAAEWVRFANKTHDYGVKYWEVGNELDGEWELGHFGRDGEKMTGEKYARLYLDFARAMRAVDPSIKIGGPTCSSDSLPFVEDLLRLAGEEVDFVSFHTYPVEGEVSRKERFAAAADVTKAVKQIREWARQYGVGEIEIGVTEWNKQVMETEHTVDLESGLWVALFLAEMAECEVDFANHWDLFSTTTTGGHGLFAEKAGAGPRAAAQVMAMWRQEMGEEWLPVNGGTDLVKVYASKGEEGVKLALVNLHETEAARVKPTIDGGGLAGSFASRRFSSLEYFWNPFEQAPEWTRAASEVSVVVAEDGSIMVPPASLLIVNLAQKKDPKKFDQVKPQIELILPADAEVGLKARGFVTARDEATGQPWEGGPLIVKMSSESDAKVTPATITLQGAVAEFEVETEQAGECVVSGTFGESVAKKSMVWNKVEQRGVTLWEFDSDESLNWVETSYAIELDRGARPNRAVLALKLEQSAAENGANTLVAPKELRAEGDKKDIRGVIGYLGASADLECADPNAAIQVVVQSELNHWIVVGRIPFKQLKGEWQRFEMSLQEKKDFQAMEKLYSVRLMLDAKKPVSGRIYVGELGFLKGI